MAKSRTSLEKSEYIVSGVKIGLSFLGPVGTILTESIEIRDRVRAKRASQFIEGLASYINTLPSGPINYNDTQKEQFAEIFESVFESAVRSSSEVRRNRLKNILCNSLKSGDVSDDMRRFISITNRISELQVQMLGLYNNHNERQGTQRTLSELRHELNRLQIARNKEAKNEKSGYANKLPTAEEALKLAQKQADDLNAIVEELPNPNNPEQFGLDKADFLSEVQELVSNGLLHDLHALGQDGLPNRHFALSSLGKRYLQYIKS